MLLFHRIIINIVNLISFKASAWADTLEAIDQIFIPKACFWLDGADFCLHAFENFEDFLTHSYFHVHMIRNGLQYLISSKLAFM